MNLVRLNYHVGKAIGPRVMKSETSRWLNKKHLEKTHAYFEKYGGKTIILARFVPIVRTFAPFVAGVAAMTRRKFSLYDVGGGCLWVGSLVTAGYLFGNLPWVQANLSLIIWAMILLPGLIVLVGAWRSRRSATGRAAA